jgi:energy-coupling factor transporter ATP-binding protein EcfA2
MKPSILIVGPDGVGKTTICKHLSDITGIATFKCPAEKQIFRDGGRQSLVFDYTLTHFLHQTGHRFLSDRSYPCEWVYAKVFERETDATLLGRIDDAHANLGTRILYVYSSVLPFQEDDIVPMERYWDVKRTYDDFCEWTGCRVTAVDTAKMLQDYRDGGDTSVEKTKQVMEMMGEIW